MLLSNIAVDVQLCDVSLGWICVLGNDKLVSGMSEIKMASNHLTPKVETLQQVLQTQFGLNDFRTGQSEAIQALFEHQRLLCIQPTGYGKSLLYQIPAAILDGITVVISPLLALMRDQVQQLNHRFSLPAVTINSDQSDQENTAAMEQLKSGQAKLVFVAPEKLDHLTYYQFLLDLR